MRVIHDDTRSVQTTVQWANLKLLGILLFRSSHESSAAIVAVERNIAVAIVWTLVLGRNGELVEKRGHDTRCTLRQVSIFHCLQPFRQTCPYTSIFAVAVKVL